MFWRQNNFFTESERAWLTATVTNFEQPSEHSHLVWIEIPIKNDGRTPARIKQIAVTNKLLPVPSSGWGRPGELPKEPDFSSDRTITLSGQDIIVTPCGALRHMHTYISPEEVKRINAREVSLYVYGFVEYLDTVKGKGHKTCFCSIYWVPEKGYNEPTGFMFSQIIPKAYFCAT